MKLLSTSTSPFGRKVAIVLREKGVPHEVKNPWQASSSVDLARHNPLGKVPALLLDDGTTLFDSVVITEYIDALPQGAPLIPSTGLERALVRRWEAVADGIAEASITIMLEGRRAEPLRDAAVVGRQLGKIRQALAFAEVHLGAQGFAHGADFSLADAALVSALAYLDLRVPDEPWRVQHPRLASYAAALEARPSVRETSPPKG